VTHTQNNALRGVFLDTATLHADALDFSALQASLPDWQLYAATSPRQVHEHLAGATVAVTNKVVLDERTLTGAPALKLICVCATGTNNVDLAAAARQGICVCNVRDYASASVAQHVFALILALATRWHDYHRDVQAGAWSRSPLFCLMDHPVMELAGKTLGIVGYGAIGREVARLGEAFGMRVMVARGTQPQAADRWPLDALLAASDVISLHCPLTPETRHLIDQQALSQMQASALLINTARGGLVDEQALADALRKRVIAGAATDVLSIEPPPADHVLLAPDIPNLLVTPHNAWISRECRQRLVDGVTDNIRGWLSGNMPNQVHGD